MSGLHSIFALIVSLATHLHSSTHERAFPIPGVSAFTPLTSIFLDIGEKAVSRHSLVNPASTFRQRDSHSEVQGPETNALLSGRYCMLRLPLGDKSGALDFGSWAFLVVAAEQSSGLGDFYALQEAS